MINQNGARNIPIRIHERLMQKILNASSMLDMKQQEVMRLAMEIGLEDLQRIGHNPASAIYNQAQSQPTTVDREHLIQALLASFKDDSSTPSYNRGRRRLRTIKEALSNPVAP